MLSIQVELAIPYLELSYSKRGCEIVRFVFVCDGKNQPVEVRMIKMPELCMGQDR